MPTTQPTPVMDLPLHQLRPRVLAVLQNQWFYPETYERIKLLMSSKNEEQRELYRRRLVAYALFAGCLTGRRLREVLGATWCSRIVWENASKRMASFSSAVFSADLDHLRARLTEERPDVVITFGNVACNAVEEIACGGFHIPFRVSSVHPAARFDGVVDELRRVRDQLDKIHVLS